MLKSVCAWMTDMLRVMASSDRLYRFFRRYKNVMRARMPTTSRLIVVARPNLALIASFSPPFSSSHLGLRFCQTYLVVYVGQLVKTLPSRFLPSR